MILTFPARSAGRAVWNSDIPVTPAIIAAKKAGISFQIHQYQHDPSADSYGLEAAEKLGVPAVQVFKTLVVSLDGKQLAVAVIPVSQSLNLKAMARACGAKKAEMADKNLVQRTTGYVLGGVSPLGQKKLLPTRVDESAQQFPTIYVSAGKRGLEIEIAAGDLCQLCEGCFAALT